MTEWGLTSGQFFQRATNSDIQRYRIEDRHEYLLYLEDVPEFEEMPSEVQKYLYSCRPALEARAAFKRGNCGWWKYTWPLHKEWYKRARLLCPYLATENRFALDATRQFIGLTDTTALFEDGQPEDLRYLLGLLNSQLLTYRFQTIGKLKSGGILEYFWNSVSKLPVRRIDFAKPGEKAKHDKMVSRVEQMLRLHKDKAGARLGQEKAMLQQQIEATDAQIDRLVYDLYGLTEDEIKIVEAG